MLFIVTYNWIEDRLSFRHRGPSLYSDNEDYKALAELLHDSDFA